MPDESTATPRDFLAVERTFLAWIRTGLALMGLGFVLARFGIFLREFNLNQPNLPSRSYGLSLWLGTALIFLGVLVCLLSLVRYRRLLQQLQRPGALLSRPSALAITAALVLAILGVAMAVYLISVRPLAQNNASKSQETSMAPIPESGILRPAPLSTSRSKSSSPRTPPAKSGSPTMRLPICRHATTSLPTSFPISP